MKEVKHWDDIFYVIDLGTREERGRFDSLDEAMAYTATHEDNDLLEIVQGVDTTGI